MVRSWNFDDPDWNKLPSGFPDCDTSGLTSKQDKHLYEAIKTAWIVEGRGQVYLYKTYAKRVLVAVAAIFILATGSYLITNGQEYANTANAKTVGQKVEGAVQATMSAVFRR